MFTHKLKLCPTVSAHPNEPSKPTEENIAALDNRSSDSCTLIVQLKAGEPTGREQLYKVFSRATRYYFPFQLAPQELDYKIHDMSAIVLEAIQRGELEGSELLLPFIHSVARKHLERYIAQPSLNEPSPAALGSRMAVLPRKEKPQLVAVIKPRVALMIRVLSCLSQRDLDILDRFYLQEQRYEHFCREMCVTETQFRLLKSRVKVNFEELSRKFGNHRIVEDSSKASYTSTDR